ncbi:MAG: tetratricopeptide repeat protein [Muribaculaceae bacterium]|nr:tetratricopeptide repeat protein [Muribaculaceae bacterium]
MIKSNISRHIVAALMLIIATVFPAVAQTLAEQADAAYTADDYATAIELYNRAAAEDGTSSVLFYNLGNAYYRNGELGKAILNYRRALRLDPGNADALANLEFVNSKIIDKPVDNDSLTDKISDRVINLMTADGWAYTTAALFLLFILFTAGYIFVNSVGLRKASFFLALIFLFASIFGVVVSISAANRQLDNNDAVILSESVQLSTSPRHPKDKSEEALLLHEGTCVHIIDSLRVQGVSDNPLWYEVTVNKEHRAWINSADVERI